MTPISAQAIVFTETSSLDLTTVDVLPPGPGEVRVQLRASGVCHSDLHVADGDWGSALPAVLGHEGAGVIEAVGEGVPKSRVGEPVALCWYAPCLHCRFCVTGRQWACQNTTANDAVMADGTTRLRRDGRSVHAFLNVGSFAEYAVVPSSGAIAMPEALPFEVAALIGCAATTGIGAALYTADVEAGSSAVVVGCGGVGLSVVMGLVLAGASRIVAVDVTAEKLAAARRAGATHLVDASTGDAVAQVAELLGGGADYVFEAAGRTSTAQQCVSMTGPAGATVLVGMPSGADAILPVNVLELTLFGKRLLGCSYGSANPSVTFPTLAELYLAGRLPLDELVGDRIGLDAVPAAFEAMRAGKGLRSVVIF